MSETVRLIFMNADATPKNVSVRVARDDMRHVMSWYSAYHAGDRYSVAMDGRDVPMDHNGEMLP